MKRLFILSFVCLFAYITKSQETNYLPFIEDGKVWYVGHYPYGDPTMKPFDLWRYYFEGDTVVAGIPCKRWMKDGKLLAPLFERNRKVYFFRAGEIVPQILYDFDVKAGECTEVTDFTSVSGEKVTCHITGTQPSTMPWWVQDWNFRHLSLYDSIGLKYMEEEKKHIDGYEDNKEEYDWELFEQFTYVWTEGIGVMNCPEFNVGIGAMSGGILCLIRVAVGDKIIYDVPEAVWPEGSGIDGINNGDIANDKFYDLSGRKISSQFKVHSSQLQKGIYIQDGKKMVRK